MSGRIGKTALILIVIGVMGYLCWPYVSDPLPEALALSPGKMPEIAPALLAPPVAPAPDRDPFQQPPVAKPAEEPPPPVVAEVPKPAPPPSAAPAPALNPPIVVKPELPVDPKDLLSGLALNATYVRGDRRLAVINGSLYAEGDQVKLSGPTMLALTLARVYPDNVILERKGQTVELNYPAAESKPARPAGEAAKTNAKPGKAR